MYIETLPCTLMQVHAVSHTLHTEYPTQCRTHQLVSLWLYLTHFWVINFCTMNCHVNPLNTKLNPICHLLALLGAHHILHVSRIRVKVGVGNHVQFPDMPHTWGTYSKKPLISSDNQAFLIIQHLQRIVPMLCQ
jgi:hypothetical protein